MSTTFKFGGAGKWAAKAGSVLAYNDLNNNFKPLPFTFTRASTATRVNESGLIESVASGVPRIDFLDNADGHLLLEPSRTNNIPYSNDFTNASWSKLGIGVGSIPVVTTNYAISPDGTQNADRIQFDLNGGTTTSDRSLIRYASLTSQTDYYFSCYVKSANGSEQKLLWDTGSDEYEFTVTNDWQRVELNRNGSTQTLSGLALRGSVSTVDTADVLVYGFQVERGSYATSYIPTIGSSVTRAAETANSAGNSQVFNDSEGVLYTEIAALANDGTERYIYLGDGTTANRVVIRLSPTSNEVRALLTSGGVLQVSSGYIATSVLTQNKIAFKYKANDFSLWVNGIKVITDTSGSVPVGLDDLSLSFSPVQFYGKVKNIQVYNQALSDSQLAALTS